MITEYNHHTPAITVLGELLASLPPDHHERAGIIRSIEVLRVDDLSGSKEDAKISWQNTAQAILDGREQERLDELSG